IDIDARTPARSDSEEEMAGAIDGPFQLGEAAVNDGLPMLLGAAPAADVVGAASATVQPGGVEGRPLDSLPAAAGGTDGGGEQPAGDREAQQTAAGLLQDGEVGDGLQAEGSPEVGVLGQVRDEAAVVGLEEGLEDQTSK